MDLNTWAIEDLYLVPTEDFVDEKGKPTHCVFSTELAALTFFGPDDLSVLKQRRIHTVDRLPD